MARKKNIAAGLDAVIYARYSSHNQREVSIEQQIAECTKHAAALGLRIVGTYEDRAISGKTDNRPRFQQMMRDAEKGKFQAVVAWKSNRIGRNMLQAMVNEAKLDDYGVKVFYAEEDFDDTAAGRFALRNMMNVNQFYSENMAEDITRGLYDNASKCMANGRQPLGYKRGEDGRVVLDEANAAVVREIFTRVAAGDLFVDIARDLNAQGIKTSKGANWNKGSFQSICQNERYRGIYIYGDVRVADGIPRIVSDDLWYRVQEAMRMKKNPVGTRHRVGAEDYLLTGKLRCGHCGSYMTGVSGTSRNGELHYYYTCQKRRTEHACDKKNIRRDVIEPAVAQAIKMYCLTDDVIAWIADRTVEYWEKHDNDLQIEALEQQLEENKKATSNMLKAIEMGIITEATRTRMVELETEQSRLSVQLNVAKEDVVKIDREQIISYLELLQQGDIHDRDFQMELFKNFLVAVYVYDDNRMKLVFSCMGDQNSVEIPLETGEDPPDGGLSPDAKMFVLTPDSSTKKALYFAGSTVLFFLLKHILGADEELGNLHSLYVDQWDWERVITAEDRNVEFLKEIVTRIYAAMVRTEYMVYEMYPQIKPCLPQKLHFIHAEELRQLYPDLEPKCREHAICKKYGAVFIIGIGCKLSDGKKHDGRAPDYDDYTSKGLNDLPGLNGDLLLWDHILQRSIELSSMGIRVDKEALLRQLKEEGEEERLELYFHKRLMNDTLPLSIGGGIGQSRLCMFYLRKAHIGEIQASIWPEDMRKECKEHNIHLI